MDKMTVAILGCGSHAQAHAIMVGRSSFAELVACADIHPERAATFAQNFNVHASYGSLEELVRVHSIDLLYIVAFPTVHPRLVIQAIELGIRHIICEKPLAITSSEAEEVFAKAKEYKAMVIEGLMYRNHPRFSKTRDLIDQGVIGDVKYIHAQFSATPVDNPENWRNKSSLGGGSLAAKGCYLIDSCNVFSRSRALQAFAYETVHPDYKVEIGFTGTLVYENGVTAQLESNHRSVGREIISVYGTKGSIVIPEAIGANDLNRHIEVHIDGEKKSIQYNFSPANGYYIQLKNAYDCIFKGAVPAMPIEDSLINYRVTDALKESTRTGRMENIIW